MKHSLSRKFLSVENALAADLARRPTHSPKKIFLYRYGHFNLQWVEHGLIQRGPAINCGPAYLEDEARSNGRYNVLSAVGATEGMLIHYCDSFFMRVSPLRDLRKWKGPRLLVCEDLHHGDTPLLHSYHI